MIDMIDIHARKLAEAAAALGIQVTSLREQWRTDAMVLEYSGHQELVISGRIYGGLRVHADMICADKHITKQVFAGLGITAPASMLIRDVTGQRDAIAAFVSRHRACVCKPVDGTNGAAVAMHLDTPDQVDAHIGAFGDRYPAFLLEEQVDGQDLRIQVIAGDVAAACVREPAYVIGDGTQALAALIASHNRALAVHNPANRVELDEVTRALLAAQGVTEASIPAPGRKIQLKHVANMAQGAIARDVTDALHPTYRAWVARLAARLDLRIFAFDAITRDPALDPTAFARALEVNARPEWLHHTFSEGRTHDIATLILRDLFRDVLPSRG